MTQERIRELLHDVADVVPPPDVADRAWRQSVRVRRRRVAGSTILAVGVIAAVLAIVGVVGDEQSGMTPVPAPNQEFVAPAPIPEAAQSREPDTRIAGHDAWIGPSIAEEERLPTTGSVLPQTVDLAAGDIETIDVESGEAPGRSIAAFASSDSEHPLREIMLAGSDGTVKRLDLSGLDLDLVEKPDGRDADSKPDTVLPLNISSLSPDGKSLVLAQNDVVVLLDLVDGGYDRYETASEGSESYYVGWSLNNEAKYWQIQLVRDVMHPETGEITKVDTSPSSRNAATEDDTEEDTRGPVEIWPARTAPDGRTAQAMVDRPVPKLADQIGDDPLLINVEGQESVTLALPVADGDHIRPRSRVVDWIGGDVVFQSQDVGTFRVLSWDTATGAVSQVSQVDLPGDWDEGVIASWADIAR